MDSSFLDVDFESGFDSMRIGDDAPVPTTSISDLIHCDTLDMSSMFLNDGTKNNTLLTMHDYFTHKTLGAATEDQCWWDRHSFETAPIGAPLKYHPNRIKTSNATHFEKNSEDENVEYETSIVEKYDDYFSTDGIFCSFPCCRSYIRREAKVDKLYEKSDSLLFYMYKKLHNLPMSKKVTIPFAGPWKTISGCGGKIPVSTYRYNCCKFTYEVAPNIKRPLMVPVSREIIVKTLN